LHLKQATCLPRPAPRLALEGISPVAKSPRAELPQVSPAAESPRAELPQVSPAAESPRAEALQVWFGSSLISLMIVFAASNDSNQA